MAQGAIIVDDGDGGILDNVLVLGATVSSDGLVFGFSQQLAGLTQDPPAATILNVRPTNVTVTTDQGQQLFQQAEASTIQITTVKGGSLTFARGQGLVRITPSAPMSEQVIVIPLPVGGEITLYFYTLNGSGRGSDIRIDQFGDVPFQGTAVYLQTSIDFI